MRRFENSYLNSCPRLSEAVQGCPRLADSETHGTMTGNLWVKLSTKFYPGSGRMSVYLKRRICTVYSEINGPSLRDVCDALSFCKYI